MEALRQRVEDAGQGHVFEGWGALTDAQRASLASQLEALDLDRVDRIFRASMDADAEPARPAEPIGDVVTLASAGAEARATYRAAGLKMIAEGRLGLLVLAGGQGTRLGSSAPKGCYDIGLPSKKPLFQLQAERIRRLEGLAAAAAGAAAPTPIPWYVMTSAATDGPTRAFFAERAFFGLRPDQVTFFSQGQLPALTEEGKLIVEAPGRLSMAPDGNGGLYTALAAGGVLADMAARGVDALDVCSVDNALVRVGDPVFAGFCAEMGVQCGARVVAKAFPEEKVGVFARRGGRMEVVEYSELDPAEACAVDPASGVLRYNWSNVCLHFFERRWLEGVAARIEAEGRYHVARKQIPAAGGGKVPGVKLEMFIFDTFPWADHTALLEVAREEEFAPVKNAPGSAVDSPDTAREAILALHRRWVEAAGGAVEGGGGVEVAPLVSYAGEGLEWVKGCSFRGPDCGELQGRGDGAAA